MERQTSILGVMAIVLIIYLALILAILTTVEADRDAVAFIDRNHTFNTTIILNNTQIVTKETVRLGPVGVQAAPSVSGLEDSGIILQNGNVVLDYDLDGCLEKFVVNGGSMRPLMDTGHHVIVSHCFSAEVLQPGDIVAYKRSSDGILILHQLIERNGERFVLRGLANDAPDEPIRARDIQGVVRAVIY